MLFNCAALSNFFSVNSAILYIELIFVSFPIVVLINVGLLLQIMHSFLPKIAKNAVFALYCEISIAEVRLRFNLVQKCRSAIAELHCASTKSKSSLRKLRCASEIKKIQLRILRCAFSGLKDRCALLRCAFDIILFVATSDK